MRVEYLEKRFRNFRKILINLLVYPPAEQRKGFNQSLSVRVVAPVGIKQQSARYFRVFTGELSPHFPDE